MEKKIVKTENISFKCKIPEIPLTRKELKNLLNFHIPCLCWGLEMLHPDEYMKLIENKKLSGVAIEAIPILEPYEKIIHPVEKQVFNMITSMAVKYHEKNYKEL